MTLVALIGSPLVGAFAVALSCSRPRVAVALGRLLLVLQCVLVASLLRSPLPEGWHFAVQQKWLPTLGVSWHVAGDAVSLWLCATVCGTAAVAATIGRPSADQRGAAWVAALLLTQACALLAVLSLDLLVACLAVQGCVLGLVGLVSGEQPRHRRGLVIPALRRGVTLTAPLLLTTLYLGAQHQQVAGYWSFDYLALRRLVLPEMTSWICYGAVLLTVLGHLGSLGRGCALPRLMLLSRPATAAVLFAVSSCVGVHMYVRWCLGLIDGPTWEAGPTLLWGVLLVCIAWPLLLALSERRSGRALVFVLIAQAGIALAGLTTGTRSGIGLSVLHCAAQAVAALAVLGVLHGGNACMGANRFSWPKGAWRGVGLVGVGALVCAPLSGGFVSVVGVASSALVSEPLGVWGKGQGPLWIALWSLLPLGALAIIGRRVASASIASAPKPWAAVGLCLAVTLCLGLAPELILGHVRDATSGMVTRYIGGRIAYQGRAADVASLRPRSGGPLDVGYPKAPVEVPK